MEKNDLVPTKVVEADSWKIELGDVHNKHKEFIKGIEKAFSIIQHQERSYGDRGLSPVSFFIGLLNIALTGFILGRFPQHYWLFQFIKSLFLMSANAFIKWKKKTILYMLDLCWMVSIFYIIFSLISVLGTFGTHTLAITGSRFMWHMIFATANGPTAWSVIVLRNAMVFHNIEKWSSLYIHLSPALVTWAMRWHADSVHKAWPEVFGSPLDDEATFGNIFGAGVAFYLIHASMYVPWLLCYGRFHGFNLKKDDYDTVYQSLMKGLPHNLKVKIGYVEENKTALKPCLIYYTIHMLATFVSFAWAYICYESVWVHTAFCVAIFTASAWWGSMTYFKMMTMYYQSRFVKYLKGLKEAYAKGDGQDDVYINQEPLIPPNIRRTLTDEVTNSTFGEMETSSV